MNELIGRTRECAELAQCVASDRSELVIVYGRRRVGKTFLIEEFFNRQFDFRYVGAHGMTTRRQLRNFAHVLGSYSKQKYDFKDWDEAFYALEDYLTELPADRKIIVFIDEMPWMDSGRSNFVSALENFWNGWAMTRRNIMLIATGSATSWMRDKLVANKGGLHARITARIHISPFTLQETEQYLERRNIEWDRYHITQAYMLLGGVPFYYSLLSPTLSLVQNIDELFFGNDATLKTEFDELYTALFNNTDQYLAVVKLLSDSKRGLTCTEIAKSLNFNGGKISSIIKNLERSDIIEQWRQFGNKKRGTVYRLTDFYTLFFYKFVESNHSKDASWWSNNLNSRSIESWMGNSFELVCMKHHAQIKEALGIRGMSTEMSTWQVLPNETDSTQGAQIDMIIERADRIIHLCEMKFSQDVYHITKEYDKHIRERVGLFKYVTGTKKTVVNTFVTTYGVANGKYSSIVHSNVVLDDLFKA